MQVLEHEQDRLAQLQEWATSLGFSQIAVSPIDLSHAEPGLLSWLAKGFHGDMDYMQRHGLKRARPAELVPGTVSVITARMNYLPASTPPDWLDQEWRRLHARDEAVVSMYARGRDYHKVMRQRLQTLADRMQAHWGPMGHRVFTDSAPVLEVELAALSGLGWRGKHSLLLNREAGSMFFLGEIFVDMALPASEPVSTHCGSCQACRTVCPTGAIVADGLVDARRCISYLTIEHEGDIPEEWREAMGNRIYGCDDCQLACPWNKYAQPSTVADFAVREPWQAPQVLQYWAWSEADFLRHTEGTPIRRIGHARWLRNVAVALGNALRVETDAAQRERLRAALQQRANHPDDRVRRHVHWALAQAEVSAAPTPECGRA